MIMIKSNSFSYDNKVEYTRHEHRQTPTVFYLKLWTFALLFYYLCMDFFLPFWGFLWLFRGFGGLGGGGDIGCAVFIVESTNPNILDLNKNLNLTRLGCFGVTAILS